MKTGKSLIPLCKDCKHQVDKMCRRKVHLSPRTGFEDGAEDCRSERMLPWPLYYLDGSCGRSGRFFAIVDEVRGLACKCGKVMSIEYLRPGFALECKDCELRLEAATTFGLIRKWEEQ